MKKRILTDDELNKVIALKQHGYSWLRIQNETEIPRHAAKNAYQIWVSSQAMEELKAARVNVATHEFQRHLDDICIIAKTLVEHLPTSILFYEKRDADIAVDEIWRSDFHEKGEEPSTPEDMFNRRSEREQRYIIRDNKLIFESLQTHTRERVRWQALQEWKTQWNTGVQHQLAITDEAKKLLANIMKDREKEVEKKIKSRGHDISKLTQQMAAGVGEMIWRSILDGTPEEAYTYVRSQSSQDGTFHVFFNLEDITLGDKDASDLWTTMCIQAVKIICKGDMPNEALDINRQLQTKVDELELMLSQVVLRTLILRTRCDLCPA